MYCKNARLNGPAKLAELLFELANMRWDIILFSETRAPTQITDLENGHRLYNSYGDNLGSGAGILINSKLVPNILGYDFISDRIVCVTMRFGHTKIAYYAVYIPHCGYHTDVYDQCYDQLMAATTKSIRKGFR